MADEGHRTQSPSPTHESTFLPKSSWCGRRRRWWPASTRGQSVSGWPRTPSFAEFSKQICRSTVWPSSIIDGKHRLKPGQRLGTIDADATQYPLAAIPDLYPTRHVEHNFSNHLNLAESEEGQKRETHTGFACDREVQSNFRSFRHHVDAGAHDVGRRHDRRAARRDG